MSPSTPLSSLSSAMEDYLEVIYHLEQERRIARVRDIADKLGVKMSSVTSALKTLGARGLIQYDPHQYIMLTDQGMEKARQIVRKHDILKRFLVSFLQIEESAAEDNACRIEHHLDPEVIDKLVLFLEFVNRCPVDQTKWITALSSGCSDCLPCLAEATEKVLRQSDAEEAAQQ